MGMTVMPSGTASPNWSGVPSRSSLAAPSAMTRCASRITTGSAHAPPIQPWTSPSAVMIAREPGWLEDGLCRQTTVASANGCPRRVSSEISSRMILILSTRCRLQYSIVRADRRRAGHVAVVRDGLPDPVRQHWHVDVADPGAGQRVHDRVDVGGRAAHRGALADALGPDRVV